MPRYITIGYGDEAGYRQTAQDVLDAAHAHDARLTRSGAIAGIAGSPVQVRNHNDVRLTTTPGPFLSSTLPVAGFAVIEAESLDEAVALVAQTPCAVAQGVVEVWPIAE